MASKQPSPEIRSSAFIAAREKCGLTIEELAHLACLSKRQIQQIENGQSSSFYSPTVKYTAAKKIAKLIQLDEKEAFDFGPQAELPLVSAAEVIQHASTSADSPSLFDQVGELPKKEMLKNAGELKEPRKVITRKRTADAKFMMPSQVDSMPVLVPTPKSEPIKRMHSGMNQQKKSGKKWFWLFPVGALVVALVQFQPLLQEQLDALLQNKKPAEVSPAPTAPVMEAVTASQPSAEVALPPTAIIPLSPVATSSNTTASALAFGCPPADAVMETYTSPSASKSGNMVYVKLTSAQVICVEDGDGKVQSKAMELGQGHSFYGKPPFKLLTSGLASAEVFFQGFRVRPSNAEAKSILLVEASW